MFFKHIHIQHFRNIESLKIDNINQVNLITGRNNCGKTSILEALFLLTGMSNLEIPIAINTFRDFISLNDEDFKYIFKDFNFSQPIKINGQIGADIRNLTIKPIYSISSETLTQIPEKQKISEKKSISNISTDIDNTIQGLTLSFNINNNKTFNAEIKLKYGEVLPARDYKEKLIGQFLTPKTIMISINNTLNSILVNKKLQGIIDALKKIEPKLIDIRMGANNMIYADIGADTLSPINIMGDGIRKILSILAAICGAQKNAILLIDELENGLHYTSLGVLWKAILKMASDNNVQLFITTHSYECIRSLVEVYNEGDKDIKKDIISLFRIERNGRGEHKAFEYDADILTAGIEKDFEVR